MTFFIKYFTRIFFLSPLLGHVGTINAVAGMAKALKKYNFCEVFLINVFGEFDNYKSSKDFKVIDIFSFGKHLPKTGLVSKFFIYFFSIFAIPILFYKIKIFRPNIIISNLVGFIPCLLKNFLKNIIIINSIQGLPKFTLIRKIIWKLFYKKSDLIFTMTNLTKQEIVKKIGINPNKVEKVDNPIIDSKLKFMALEKISQNEENVIFKNNFVICAVGRLTKQKNFLDLIKIMKEKKFQQKKIKLIILGEGEKRKELEKFIKKNNIKNIHLLGFKKNPFKYMFKSNLFVSTSLWEEPGHTILEAGYLNNLVLSSNCPNGPKEILKNKFNSLVFDLNIPNDLENKLIEAIFLNENEKKSIKLNMKKLSKNYTMFRFSKKISSIVKKYDFNVS